LSIYKELFCGWLILAVVDRHYWTVECYRPLGETYVDKNDYLSLEEAVAACREYISKRIAITSIKEAFLSIGDT
jgi:hypothetical protein